jgi:formyltetrahydrofolate synthetase
MLVVAGAMTVVMKDAIGRTSQTLEGQPALVHAGPLATSRMRRTRSSPIGS